MNRLLRLGSGAFLLLSLGGCPGDSDQQPIDTDSSSETDDTDETDVAAEALPGAFQQPRTGAAAGRMTSENYQMVFSLGGQPPPMAGQDHHINHPPTEEAP